VLATSAGSAASTDALGKDTYYYYANSRMTKMENALGQETDFAYDFPGRRVTTTFPSGSSNHLITEYDLLGRATGTGTCW